MPTEGKQRKGRIIKKLFRCTDDTLMQLKFFSSVLPLLKEFLPLFQFQQHDPLIDIFAWETSFSSEAVSSLFHEGWKPEARVWGGVHREHLLSADVARRSSHWPPALLFVLGHCPSRRRNILECSQLLQPQVLKQTLQEPSVCGWNSLLKTSFWSRWFESWSERSAALSKLLELPSLLPGVLNQDEEAEVCYDKEVSAFLGQTAIPPLNEKQWTDEW